MTLEEEVVSLLREHHLTITTAESCTGGLIAGTLINVAGVSEYLKEAYITYSDEAKEKLLGVDPKIIETYTVVSRETAEAMACGGAKAAGCNICVSATGIAGPDGGTAEKPVGLAYIGIAHQGKVQTFESYYRNVSRKWNRHYTLLRMLFEIYRLIK